nr:(d)CMP kinase [Nakamurella lactea]
MTELIDRFVIAIDGPSGTGKSTVAKHLARQLRAGYLDTGAMYRIVTLAILRAGVDPADEAAVADHLPLVQFHSPTDPDRQQHDLDGDDVTAQIRGGDVTLAVTPVSANPAVREWLMERQQQLAHTGRMVVEGRDIGTVIAPDATLKVYLTADESERARRRHRQNGAVNVPAAPNDLDAVRADLNRRDTVDSGRATAPLRAADDAIHLDSSDLTADQVVEQILAFAAERGIN